MVCITCVISFYFGNNTSSCIVLHNLQSYCFVLHHLASSCIILHPLASPCITLHRLALTYTISHHLASSCIVLHCLASSCIVLHHLAPSCILLHRLALSCIILQNLLSSCIVLHHLAKSCIISHCLASSCTQKTPRNTTHLEDIGLPIPAILQTSSVHISIWMFKAVRQKTSVPWCRSFFVAPNLRGSRQDFHQRSAQLCYRQPTPVGMCLHTTHSSQDSKLLFWYFVQSTMEPLLTLWNSSKVKFFQFGSRCFVHLQHGTHRHHKTTIILQFFPRCSCISMKT